MTCQKKAGRIGGLPSLEKTLFSERTFEYETERYLCDANDKASVEADLNALKDLLAQTANAQELTDSQVADIKAAQEKMMESAQKLFSKMYEQTQGAQGQAGPGPDMGNMGGNSGAQGGNEAGYGDDVVDADYKEV